MVLLQSSRRAHWIASIAREREGVLNPAAPYAMAFIARTARREDAGTCDDRDHRRKDVTTQDKRTAPKPENQDTRETQGHDDAHERQAHTDQTVANRRGDQHPSSKKPDSRDG